MPPRLRRRRYLARRLRYLLLTAALLAGLAVADRFGLFGRAPTPDFQKYHNLSALVVRVIDGDTLDVDVPDDPYPYTRVRLWGVDTPETVKPNTPVQHFGREASQAAKDLVLSQTVRLELVSTDTRDKYGRLLAYMVLPDGRLLNAVLIEEGFGYADPRFDHPRKREFARLGQQARKAGRGLWKNATDADLPEYLRP